MIAGFLALEQPDTWSRAPPISAENVEKARRQHGVSFLAAFAHLDVDQHRVLSMEAILRRVTSLTRKPAA